MNGKIKGLVLCLTASLALGAAASAAQADQFRAVAAPAFLTSHSAASNQVFTFTKPAGTTVSSVSCTTYQFSDEVGGIPTSSVSLHPTYANCLLSTGLKMKIEIPSKCDFRLTLPAAGTKATMDIVGCTAANPIKMVGVGCIIEIGPQASREHVQLSSNPAKTDFEAAFTVTNMTGTQTAGCPGGAGANVPDFSGSATVTGFTDSLHTKAQSTWVE